MMKKILLSTMLSASLLLPQLTYAAEAPKAPMFEDISPEYRFFEDIQLLLNQFVIDPASNFYPFRPMNRLDVAIGIARAKNLPPSKQPSQFKDIDVTTLEGQLVQAVADAGLISGFPDGTFKPTKTVTRGEMALFLQRSFQLIEGKRIHFTDMSPRVASYEAVQSLIHAGYTTGFPDGTFRPSAPLQRGEAAHFLAKAVQDSLTGFYLPGIYIAGQKIPAGEYLYVSIEEEGKFTLRQRSGQTYTRLTPANAPYYVTVKQGEQIEFVNGFLYRSGFIRHQPKLIQTTGTYKVGYDLPIGTYRAHVAPNYKEGTLRILNDSTVEAPVKFQTTLQDFIIFSVERGDYVELEHVTMEPYKGK